MVFVGNYKKKRSVLERFFYVYDWYYSLNQILEIVHLMVQHTGIPQTGGLDIIL
jgi:hypothetical protein